MKDNRMDLPLFPAIDAGALLPPPPPIKFKYFLLAYWPTGGWWRVFAETLYELPNSPGLLDHAANLAKKGWMHIRVVQLPEIIESKK